MMRSVSDVIGARIREVRRRRGWTTAQLAERCAEVGCPGITASVVNDLETGRRDKATGRRRRHITVDELLALAYALDVAPVHLLVPTEGNDPYPVTPEWFVPPARAREWTRGQRPLQGADPRIFFAEVPAEEFPSERVSASGCARSEHVSR